MDGEDFGPEKRAELNELAERCLRSNQYPALKNVTCNLLNGVLVLRGFVPTYFLKQIAQEAVCHLGEVMRIHNEIQVMAPVHRSDRGYK